MLIFPMNPLSRVPTPPYCAPGSHVVKMDMALDLIIPLVTALAIPQGGEHGNLARTPGCLRCFVQPITLRAHGVRQTVVPVYTAPRERSLGM